MGLRKLDHDEERLKIAEIAAKLIAQNGVHNLTTSHIADAMGATRGKVLHYFKGTQQIIDAAFDWANTNAEKRMADFASGLAALELNPEELLNILPLTEETDIEWKVRLSCWESSLSDKESNAFQLSVSESRVRDGGVIFDLLQKEGVLRNDIEPTDFAKLFGDLMSGLGIILLNYPLEERRERCSGIFAFLKMCGTDGQASESV